MSVIHNISGGGDPGRKGDVIFVHGLGGHYLDTWRYENNSQTWPQMLGGQHQNVGIWSLEYPADPTKISRIKNFFSSKKNHGHSMPLPRRAKNVLEHLKQKKLGGRPTLFVCHSLGGLVVKHVLRKAYDLKHKEKHPILNTTQAVLFLATPHHGSPLASLLDNFRKIFGTTCTVDELQAHDAYLEDLNDWYGAHAGQLGIYTKSFYETKPIMGFTIVDATSANPGIGDISALDEDHLSIAKPDTHDHLVWDTVNCMIKDSLLKPAKKKGEQKPKETKPNQAIVVDLTKKPEQPVINSSGRSVEGGETAVQPVIMEQASNKKSGPVVEGCVTNEADQKKVAFGIGLHQFARDGFVAVLAEEDMADQLADLILKLPGKGQKKIESWADHLFAIGSFRTVFKIWKHATEEFLAATKRPSNSQLDALKRAVGWLVLMAVKPNWQPNPDPGKPAVRLRFPCTSHCALEVLYCYQERVFAQFTLLTDFKGLSEEEANHEKLKPIRSGRGHLVPKTPESGSELADHARNLALSLLNQLEDPTYRLKTASEYTKNLSTEDINSAVKGKIFLGSKQKPFFIYKKYDDGQDDIRSQAADDLSKVYEIPVLEFGEREAVWVDGLKESDIAYYVAEYFKLLERYRG